MDNIYSALLAQIKNGSKCAILTYLNYHSKSEGSIEKKLLLTQEEIDNNTNPNTAGLYEKVSYALESGGLQLIEANDGKAVLIEPFMPKPRLIVFGGGHIAKPLCEYASRVGFLVTVIDDRPSFANAGRFPNAENAICEEFKKSFDKIKLRKTDFIVVITRGHKHDGVVLREVLKHDVRYMGMIGSKRRVSAMKEEFILEGYAKERLDLVNAPIGLDISAITPDEIAIAIAAQLISYKNKSVVDKFGKDFSYPELDTEVALQLCQASDIPRALVTILSSKGSVPRKSGAMMLAYYDGRTVGSIGGGCSEAAVLSKAKDLMLSKGFLVQHIDMTGDIAESEGMVCGGVMEVLIEAL